MLYKYLCLSIVLMSSLVIFDRTVIYVSYMYICCLYYIDLGFQPFKLGQNVSARRFPTRSAAHLNDRMNQGDYPLVMSK